MPYFSCAKNTKVVQFLFVQLFDILIYSPMHVPSDFVKILMVRYLNGNDEFRVLVRNHLVFIISSQRCALLNVSLNYPLQPCIKVISIC